MNEQLTRLVELAAEIGTTPDKLADRLADNVLVDRTGFRCVEPRIAAAVIDERIAAQARAKQRGTARRQRLAAASQRVRDGLRGGFTATPDGNPIADMILADGDSQRVREGAERLEGWLRGVSEGRLIRPLKGA